MDKRVPHCVQRLVWHEYLRAGSDGLTVSSRTSRGGATTVQSVSLWDHLNVSKSWGWLRTPAAFHAPANSAASWSRVQWTDVSLDLSKAQLYDEIPAALDSLGIPHDRCGNPMQAIPFMDKLLLVPTLTLLEGLVCLERRVGTVLLHPLSLRTVRPLPSADGTRSVQISRPVRREDWPSPADAVALARWSQPCYMDALSAVMWPIMCDGRALEAPKVLTTVTFGMDGYMCGELVVVQALGDMRDYPYWPDGWESITLVDEGQEPIGTYKRCVRGPGAFGGW